MVSSLATSGGRSIAQTAMQKTDPLPDRSLLSPHGFA
jgi:hypothetical protein